jgi:quercetin dioxygenase-like cupin family protein
METTKLYVHIPELTAQLPAVPTNSIISNTFYRDEQVKVMLFSFAPGQELSEHTASVPAILHFLQGEGRLTLGGDEMDAKPGTWVHMPANLTHSIQARTPLLMLLMMFS